MRKGDRIRATIALNMTEYIIGIMNAAEEQKLENADNHDMKSFCEGAISACESMLEGLDKIIDES